MQFATKDDRFATRQNEPVRRARGRLWIVFLAALVLPNTGCSITNSVRNYIAYNDSQNDFVMGFRNGVWARQAWAERSSCFEGEPQLGSFGAGFRAGYTSVASGGNGCPPAVPPRKYWTWKYQTPEGQAKVAAWFSGFPHGAQAAEEDQAGEYQNIQVSYAIEHQYSPGFSTSQFIEQNGLEQQQQQPLEALPNPSFVPAPVVPLSESAMHSPGLFPVPGNMEGIESNGLAGPGTTIPVVYQQPVEPSPQPPEFSWPQ